MNKTGKIITAGAAFAAAGLAAAKIYKSKQEKQTGFLLGETVLITGASGGLGKEFADIFAECGFNLVLAARSEDKLKAIAEEIEGKYGVRVNIFAMDLSVAGSAEDLYDKVKDAGIEVDQLVNNAGVGKYSRVIDTDPATIRKIVNLNATSVAELCALFGADMAKRGKGRIMNVSSLGAFIPDPYFNVYAPSKAFELSLTEAMYGEMKKSGISVTALCPGPIKTNWAANAGKADSITAKDPHEVAEEGFIGMQKGELIVIPAALYKAEKAAMSVLPVGVQADIIAKFQKILVKRGEKKAQ